MRSCPDGSGLSIEHRIFGQRTVLVVGGQVDLATVETFRVAVERALAGGDRVELDLSATSFMDSTGLAVIINASRRLRGRREVLVVRNPTAAVRKLLTVTGVDQLIDVRSEAPAPGLMVETLGRSPQPL
jgi:anti-sigma B factor antagonist